MFLGLLNCSSKKLPVPAPAWLMYSRSPRFSQQYQSLRAACDEVRIVSAKYGLVTPDQVLQPYDQRIGTSTQFAKTVAGQINRLAPDHIRSYLTKDYRAVLLTVTAEIEEIGGDLYRMASAVGRQGRLNRSDRWVVCWPIEWLLIYVAEHSPVPLPEVLRVIRGRYLNEGTVRCQYERVQKCPLHEVSNGLVRNKYV